MELAGFEFAPTVLRRDRCECRTCKAEYHNYRSWDDVRNKHNKDCPYKAVKTMQFPRYLQKTEQSQSGMQQMNNETKSLSTSSSSSSSSSSDNTVSLANNSTTLFATPAVVKQPSSISSETKESLKALLDHIEVSMKMMDAYLDESSDMREAAIEVFITMMKSQLHAERFVSSPSGVTLVADMRKAANDSEIRRLLTQFTASRLPIDNHVSINIAPLAM